MSVEDNLRRWIDGQGYPLEMRTAEALRDAGRWWDHGRVYEDPVTGKVREIDLVADIASDDHAFVQMIVECKPRPLYGPDHVARWILGVLVKPVWAGFTLESADINGELGTLALIGGNPGAALTYDIVDGRIQNLRFQINPNKLKGLYMGTDTLG